jgi:hypothetical protein
MADDTSDNEATATVNQPTLLCKKKKCKSGTAVSRCSVNNCPKCSCVTCYMDMVSKYKLKAIVNSKGEIIMACSKTHYTMSAKNISQLSKKDAPATTTKYGWNNDGKDGPNDPNTSMNILLNWLMEEGNFDAFLKCDRGMTKKKFALKIADLINGAGVLCLRDDKQVLNKIFHMQKLYKDTRDWAYNTTGQGVKEANADSWEATIRKKCTFFFDLQRIIGDRASASPVIDSEKGIDLTDDASDSHSESFSQSILFPKDPPVDDGKKKSAKDVLKVGDIIVYKDILTDQEGDVRTEKKITQIIGIDLNNIVEEDDDVGLFFPLILLDNKNLHTDTMVSQLRGEDWFFLHEGAFVPTGVAG